MKKCACVFLLSFTLTCLHGQNPTVHEVLLDISPLLRTSQSVNVQYRRLLGIHSLRLSGNLQFDGTNHSSETSSSATTTSTLRVNSTTRKGQYGIRLGLQNNGIITDRCFFYYGADLMLNRMSDYSHIEEHITGGFGVPRTISETRQTEWQYGIIPLLGIGYEVNARFSIQVESGAGLYRSYADISSSKLYYFKTPQGVESLNNTDITNGYPTGFHISMSAERFFRLFAAYKF